MNTINTIIKYIFLFLFIANLSYCTNQNKSKEEINKLVDEQITSDSTVMNNSNIITYNIEVINKYKHDSRAYTQGLVYYDGYIIEGTGLLGESTLRKVELNTGKVLKNIKIPSYHFGEGVCILNNKIYQLTWITNTCIVYDLNTLQEIKTYHYKGEGWGLTTDGNYLIMSNGTSTIKFIDPETFDVINTIEVSYKNQSIDNINELEIIDGDIWANIYQTDKIAIIDINTGRIKAYIILSDLYQFLAHNDFPEVLNGIAYDSINKRIFLTGKFWPFLFEVKLIKK